MLEHLPNIHKALGSISSTKEEREKGEQERRKMEKQAVTPENRSSMCEGMERAKKLQCTQKIPRTSVWLTSRVRKGLKKHIINSQ